MRWEFCPLNHDYEVSDAGLVRRVVRVLPRGRKVPYELGQRAGSSPYLYVSLTINGEPKNIMVHSLVLQTFVGPRPSERHHAAHLDGNVANNRLSNLRWVTREENEAHKRGHGTAFSPRKLTEADVLEMRRLYRDCDASCRSLAKQFGVSVPTAHGVIVGRYWPHIPGAVAAKSKGRKTSYVAPRHKDDNPRRTPL